MKLISALVPALAATTAAAQMVNISTPTTGQNLTAGQPFLVELDSMDGLTNFQDVGVAIGIQSCAPAPCVAGASPVLGTVLYAGNFTPQRHDPVRPAYQTFTLTVPPALAAGDGLLSVSHFYLVGAGFEPILEMKNTTVTIMSA